MRKAHSAGRVANRATDDHELIDACIAGSPRAWETLVERYSRLVFTVALRAGLGRDDADDAHQAVFAGLFRHLAGIRDRTCLSSWLITTARREAYRIGRRRAAPAAADALLTLAKEDDPADDRLERQQMVRIALDRLSRRDRDLLTALFQNTSGNRYEAIAGTLGMKVGSIGPTRARAIERMRAILVELGYRGEMANGCRESGSKAA